MRLVSKNDGFTLVEVLAALIILVVVAVPMAMMFYQGSLSADITGKKTTALYLAHQKLEGIIATGTTAEEQGEFSGAPGYTYEVSVTPDGKMALVTVTVFYSVSGKQREVSLSTLLPGG